MSILLKFFLALYVVFLVCFPIHSLTARLQIASKPCVHRPIQLCHCLPHIYCLYGPVWAFLWHIYICLIIGICVYWTSARLPSEWFYQTSSMWRLLYYLIIPISPPTLHIIRISAYKVYRNQVISCVHLYFCNYSYVWAPLHRLVSLYSFFSVGDTVSFLLPIC